MKTDAVLYLLICLLFLGAAMLFARAIEESYLMSKDRYEEQYRITEERR